MRDGTDDGTSQLGDRFLCLVQKCDVNRRVPYHFLPVYKQGKRASIGTGRLPRTVAQNVSDYRSRSKFAQQFIESFNSRRRVVADRFAICFDQISERINQRFFKGRQPSCVCRINITFLVLCVAVNAKIALPNTSSKKPNVAIVRPRASQNIGLCRCVGNKEGSLLRVDNKSFAFRGIISRHYQPRLSIALALIAGIPRLGSGECHGLIQLRALWALGRYRSVRFSGSSLSLRGFVYRENRRVLPIQTARMYCGGNARR